MFCLLQAGIGRDEETVHDSTPKAFEGMRFGVYEIDCYADGSLCELGRGAMGVTYRATDTSLQRKVALKIIKTDIAERSADARERFLREARSAAAFRHEHIATIYQFGMRLETGQYFYAMELIEGETLDDRVHRAGPLNARTTIGIAEQVTSALAAAEKHGLVHRDLKPANLMLVNPDDNGAERSDQSRLKRSKKNALRKRRIPVVKIIDFGLAKAFHTTTDPKSLTQDRFVGTPAFASPEQFEHSTLTVRSDIYSLGETLWFALTARTPFGGHDVEEIYRAQQLNVLPIEQLKAAHVPANLRSLLESMLAVEPACRPGTHELAARLQRSSPEARSVRRTRITLLAAVLLVFGLSTLFLLQQRRIQNAISKAAPDKTIAVLPFENRSEDKGNAYFADGIQDEILTRLCKIADLKVISRTSTLRYQSNPGNLREIAKQLGVQNILEGSVQKVADHVRVNVQLINAQTDSHLWAEIYDRKVTDILAVESDVAKAIAASLRAKLTGGEEQALAVRPTNNPEAYDFYLRGLALEANIGYSNDALWKAIDFYERAVELDPQFAFAWARLSRAEAFSYFHSGDTTSGHPDVARRALETAQVLQPNAPEIQLALGWYQCHVLRDYALAKATFKEVNKRLPGNSEVLDALAAIARREGHWDEGIAYLEQALVLDPRNPDLLSGLGFTYAVLRRFPLARQFYDRTLDIIPNDPDLMAVKACIYQAEGNLKGAAEILSPVNVRSSSYPFSIKITQLTLERNFQEAVRLLQERQTQFNFASEIDKGVNQLLLASAQRLAGDTAAAKTTAAQARKIFEPLCKNQPDNLACAQDLAVVTAVLGDRDGAIKEAERTITLLPSARDRLYGPSYEELLALVQTMLGDNNRAIATLGRLLKTPYSSTMLYGPAPVTPALLRLDSTWDALRADPSFQKLCQERQP
jgi:serine/threonine protein kinase/Tfp pilus assembly protein PilF